MAYDYSGQSPRGFYRHYVALEALGASVPDGDGGFTQGVAPLDPPASWASIRAANARDLERLGGGTLLTTATHIVVMPYHPGVTTQSRIVFEGRTFTVSGVQNPEERGIETIAICEEIQA